MVDAVTVDTYLLAAGRLTLGILFAFSGAAKLLDLPQFSKVVADFGILPPRLVRVFAPGIVLAELSIAALLVLGIAVAWALLAVLLLLTLFTIALVRALSQGRRVDCRCFGGLSRGPASWGSVARNLLLAVLGIGTLLGQVGSTQRTLERIDFMLVGLLVLSAVAVIALVSEAGALLAGPAGARSGR